MTTLIFPVGHYLGPHYRPDTAAPAGHRLRLGPSLRWLVTEPELLAWTLAHGLGELADEEEHWTRAAVTDHAGWLAETDVAEAIGGLLERRLLVEVDPEQTEAAAGFARGHRLRALLLALGADPEDPEAVLLGTAGSPRLALSERGYSFWQAGQHSQCLWEACQLVAKSGSEGGTDPGELLPEILGELHGLLGAGAAYLDIVEGEGGHAGIEIH